MKFNIIFAVFILFPPIASAWTSNQLRDAALEKSIEGYWCNSDDNGKTCWGFDHLSNGSAFTCIQVGQKYATAKSRYVVRGNSVCHEVTESSEPEVMRPGYRICLEVVEINEHMQKFRYFNSKEIITIFRTQRAKATCPAART